MNFFVGLLLGFTLANSGESPPSAVVVHQATPAALCEAPPRIAFGRGPKANHWSRDQWKKALAEHQDSCSYM